MTAEVIDRPKEWRAFEADPLEGLAEAPYPGLRPFLPRERDIFFGREQMIDQVLVRLNEQHMVVVHGASGCGKSSLIAAGVLPQLARRRARRGLVLKTGTFRPGIQPMQSLVGLIGELCGAETGPAPLDAVYRAISGGAGVARAGVARLAADAGVDQLCIVIDQFEELFRFAEDEGYEEAQRFADLLVQLCGGGEEAGWWEADGAARPAEPVPAEISFILTMRSEFLGNCSRYPGLAEAINRTQYLLPNMGRDDLIRAIREPAEVFDGQVEHALAERMADDAVREEDSLPLIQHALMQMWLASENGRLGLADYDRVLEGSAQSAQARQRGPLGAILAGHADRVLAETAGGDPARERAIEFIFRALTRKDSESRAIRFPQRFWRLTRLSGLGEEATRGIVDAFRRDTVSFLTPYQATTPSIGGETVIDISHEALIRTWPRMSDRALDEHARPVGWIEREAQDAMLWRWLSVHAEFFSANNRAWLDGATTERLTAWFERIRERPDWVRPYLVRPTGKDDVTKEPEWQAVETLLKESHDRNWLDRTMLKRWRKLGWVSAVLLVLVILGAGYGGYRLYEALKGRDQQLQTAAAEYETEAAADDARALTATSLRAADATLQLANKDAAAPAATADRVPVRAADAATGGGGPVLLRGAGGFIWIGTDGSPPVVNLSDPRGRPAALDRVASGDFAVTGPTIVRSNFPGGEEGHMADAVGILPAGSPVVIRHVQRIERNGVPEYWARADLLPGTPGRVDMTFAHSQGLTLADELDERLDELGYDARPPVQADGAINHADAYYCFDEDRPAAIRLAVSATRLLAISAETRGITIAARRGSNCGGVVRGQLSLMIDFLQMVDGQGR